MTKDLTDTALAVLNKFYSADPEACTDLFSKKVLVNGQIISDPNFIAREKKGGKHEIGLLGIINAVLNASGATRIAVITEEDGSVAGFSKSSGRMGHSAPPAPPPPPPAAPVQ